MNAGFIKPSTNSENPMKIHPVVPVKKKIGKNIAR